MSTISVVIPSRDDARMLRHCLAALAVQTRKPDEVIVVDNGSSDDTAAVARAAGARVVDEPRPGVLRATAAGFDAAEGDIIGRLDADSIPSREWIARLEQRFDDDPTLTGITGTGRFYGGTWPRRVLGRYAYLGGYFWSMRLVMGHVPVFGSNFALRREAWQTLRPHLHMDDPRMHDDLEISFALQPDMGVEFDRELRVGVSARPFDSMAGFRRRVNWAFHGLAVNLSEESIAERQWRCAAGRRERRRLQRDPRRASQSVTRRSSPASLR
ncbi:glycosyltransferase family 2 protein [Microbacterium sp. zg.Y1090]|uniref:glycosyltransferase family A protein n=1 Tax=Microbacterium TaxID=33882 RepID=UPI00214CBE03|nr:MULTISPECIES: glycosyltransferase family A protein [unclassified Microbacterium]MCR2812294.1 glycosyltransferase family 2 protein [Microbacterium sp. zg.Y1084]MCR2819816.1 glycosyltransferase family 2 protein [Microbacterium sp. zg.Y1090]MDL5485451.1 glycosyltransferase family A protein [Microbacterium sp. zg-Y1211]WIM28627.1 glycosyltransferase family A protein [Microbacterium sp. zg-Y1090]